MMLPFPITFWSTDQAVGTNQEVQIPGSSYINETMTIQVQVPGGVYVNEGGV
jgi:hypothetical protein